MMKKPKKFIFIFISLQIHICLFLIISFFNLLPEKVSVVSKTPLNIQSMRTIGKEDSLKRDLIYAKTKSKKMVKKKIKTKDLAFFPLEDISLGKFQKKETRPGKESLLKKKKTKNLKKLSINNSTIKDFLRTTPGSNSSAQQLAKLDDTNVLFDLEVPKGVKEDELNEHELVFYSFRKRTAIAYVNSFQKNLNIFETQNPHLQFPLTKGPETISGKITYDKNGDILRIETLKYTQIQKLQNFFMEVLKDMNSIPNPPKEIINSNDQFVINFILSINTRFQ